MHDTQLTEKILAAVDAGFDEQLRFTERLTRIPSLRGQEAPAQDMMAVAMRARGLAVDRWRIDVEDIRHLPGFSPVTVSYDDAWNVVGAFRARDPAGRTLILNGHIDVVPTGPADMWTTPPFEVRIADGWMYGRGSGDMKAGLAANLFALDALKRAGVEPAADVYLQSVVEEECTGNGALACLVQGHHADAAIITEPGDAVLLGQLGVMWLTIEVTGVPVHAMVAHTGTNAIDAARSLFAELRLLEREWNEPTRRHPMWCAHDHPINFNLGRLVGGEWPSSVATTCRADIRLSFYPDMTRAEVRRAIEDRLAEAHAAMPGRDGIRWRVEYRGFQSEGCVLDRGQPLVTELAATHREVTGEDVSLVVGTGTTDARSFNLYGPIPATCYGPRGVDIHGIDEWVSIASMQQVSAVLALFIARWCGLDRIDPKPR